MMRQVHIEKKDNIAISHAYYAVTIGPLENTIS